MLILVLWNSATFLTFPASGGKFCFFDVFWSSGHVATSPKCCATCWPTFGKLAWAVAWKALQGKLGNLPGWQELQVCNFARSALWQSKTKGPTPTMAGKLWLLAVGPVDMLRKILQTTPRASRKCCASLETCSNTFIEDFQDLFVAISDLWSSKKSVSGNVACFRRPFVFNLVSAQVDPSLSCKGNHDMHSTYTHAHVVIACKYIRYPSLKTKTKQETNLPPPPPAGMCCFVSVWRSWFWGP